MTAYAVGFARPDRWSRERPAVDNYPWHAVEAHRAPAELDGEIELAVCGTIVQVWGAQDWTRVGAGRTACPECVRTTAVVPSPRSGSLVSGSSGLSGARGAAR